MTKTTRIEGFVAPGFEEVRKEFERNFADRGEIGAVITAYWRARGKTPEDLCGNDCMRWRNR
ncbi:MAG TPA: hypothetical protein VF836_00200 [Gemmatimonadaceae bacterium]